MSDEPELIDTVEHLKPFAGSAKLAAQAMGPRRASMTASAICAVPCAPGWWIRRVKTGDDLPGVGPWNQPAQLHFFHSVPPGEVREPDREWLTPYPFVEWFGPLELPLGWYPPSFTPPKLKVFAAVYQFDAKGPTTRRHFEADPVLNDFHHANLVIVWRGGELVRHKDRYSDKRGDVLTEAHANRRVDAHIGAVHAALSDTPSDALFAWDRGEENPK